MEKIIGISEDDVKGYVFVKEVNDFNVLLSEVLWKEGKIFKKEKVEKETVTDEKGESFCISYEITELGFEEVLMKNLVCGFESKENEHLEGFEKSLGLFIKEV